VSEKNKGSFSPKSFSSDSFTLDNFHYVPKSDENLIANVSGQNINISGQIKEFEIKKQDHAPAQINVVYNTINYQSFNPTTTTHSIFQHNSVENILTFLNSHQNISIENKTILQSHIKEFEQESKKNNPDHAKLKAILNYIYPIAKDVALMLFKNSMDNGVLKF
jgi:hypothetical protein